MYMKLRTQHERGALDIKERRRGINVNFKELHVARAKDVLVLKIKERRAFNVPWNLSAAHYELKTSEGAASPGRRGRGHHRSFSGPIRSFTNDIL